MVEPAREKRASAAGLSLIELVVTLLMVALLTVSVLKLLDNTTQTAGRLDEYMARHAAIQHSLDMLIDDIVATSQSGAKMYVKRESMGWRDTSHLTIVSAPAAGAREGAEQIDWIAVPSDDEDLVLFRRVKKSSDRKPAMYIPVCRELHSFDVQLLNEKAMEHEDPNYAAPLVQVVAEVYQPGQRDPDRVLTVSRTFCVERFQ